MLSNMSWQQKPHSSELEKLGKMTVRLLRVVTYEKLARAQAQLRAQGIKTDFVTPFKHHAARDLERLKIDGTSSQTKSKT